MSTQVREFANLPLSPEQQMTFEELRPLLTQAIEEEVMALTRLLATKTDATFFGETEFQIRDLVMHLGAKALQTAVAFKKKRATPVHRAPVPPVRRQPGSIAGSAGTSSPP